MFSVNIVSASLTYGGSQCNLKTICNKQVLRALFILVASFFASCEEQGPTFQPVQNILFIPVDDLRPELGCYGNSSIQTPNIDRLARQGVIFERAYCQQAVCNPSRASLLTGLRPDSIRVWDLYTNFRKNVPDAITLPQFFKQKGYTTVGLGKTFHNTIPDTISWTWKPHIDGFPFDPLPGGFPGWVSLHRAPGSYPF